MSGLDQLRQLYIECVRGARYHHVRWKSPKGPRLGEQTADYSHGADDVYTRMTYALAGVFRALGVDEPTIPP